MLGDRVKQRRQELDLTQEELAKTSGLKQFHISQIERGGIVEVTSYAGLTVLGEAGSADTQQILDRLHGGYAAIACSRAN